MPEKEFIAETSNKQKIKIFFIACFILLTAVSIGVAAITFLGKTNTISFKAMHTFVLDEIKRPSVPSLFYLGFLGDLFFNPLPTEPLMIFSMQKGNPILLSLITLLTGLIAGNGVNYLIGQKFSKFIFIFISRKEVYKSRRQVNKYGAYAVFAFNLIPILPSPVLSFGLGIAKYNLTRFFIFMILGILVKLVLIILLFFMFHGHISYL